MAQEPFEYVAYETTLSEIKVKLAELRYIDDALAWMQEQNGKPGTEGFEEEHRDGAAINPVVYTLGTSYPFQYVVDYWDPDAADQRAGEAHLKDLSTSAALWAYAEVASLREDNIEITKPYPGDFQQAAEGLQAVWQQAKEDVPLDLGHFGSSLGDWEGMAALAFDRNFVGPFKDVREAHLTALARMAGCFSTAKAIVDCGQHSMMNAVATVRDLVDDQLQQRQASHAASLISKDTLSMTGSTLGLIGGAMALTGVGAGAGGVVGFVGGAISYAAERLPEDAAEAVDVSAASAEETLGALADRFFATRVAYLKQWNSLRMQDVEPICLEIASDAEAGDLWPPRPSMSSSDPGGFHHESSEQYT